MTIPCSEPIKVINLSNIRLGFATNSSSTHSIVINPEKYGEVEWPLQTFLRVDMNPENYRITDPQHRLVLFAQSLYASIVNTIGKQAAQAVVCEFCGVDRHALTHYQVEDNLVSFAIPTVKVGTGIPSALNSRPEWDPNGPTPNTFCEEYLRDLMSFLVSNKSVGWVRSRENEYRGEDEEDPDLQSKFVSGELHSMDPRYQWVARADGNWWVLMNRNTGAKLRVNFANMEEKYVKSTLPELVDLKITDHCPYNCSFCYQGSTPDGKHGKFEYLQKYVDVLKAMGTFEIAIGGGEPTLHPKFDELVTYIHNAGIQPNFTTRNMAYLKKASSIQLLERTNARFAVSVDTLEAAKKAVEEMKSIKFSDQPDEGVKPPRDKYYRRMKDPYTLQVILGSDAKEVTKILLYANAQEVDVTLLGYKTSGRGAIDLSVKGTTLKKLQSSYKESFSKDIEELANSYRFRISVGVDTLAITQLPFLLGSKYERLITPGEGAFSMYIDGVADTMSCSSYEEPEASEPLHTAKALKLEKEQRVSGVNPTIKQLYTAIASSFSKW